MPTTPWATLTSLTHTQHPTTPRQHLSLCHQLHLIACLPSKRVSVFALHGNYKRVNRTTADDTGGEGWETERRGEDGERAEERGRRKKEKERLKRNGKEKRKRGQQERFGWRSEKQEITSERVRILSVYRDNTKAMPFFLPFSDLSFSSYFPPPLPSFVSPFGWKGNFLYNNMNFFVPEGRPAFLLYLCLSFLTLVSLLPSTPAGFRLAPELSHFLFLSVRVSLSLMIEI